MHMALEWHSYHKRPELSGGICSPCVLPSSQAAQQLLRLGKASGALSRCGLPISKADGCSSGGEKLVHEMFDALLYHLTFCHNTLARSMHTAWQSLAAHEDCVPELIRIMVDLCCSRLSMYPGHAGVTVSPKRRVVQGTTPNALQPSEEVAGSTARISGCGTVLQAAQAAILAISSKQPRRCAATNLRISVSPWHQIPA